MDAARLRVYLGRMLESFRSCAEAKASFEPEHQACAEIVRLFEAQGIDGESLREAVAIMNRVSETAHYNGSLWFDLQAQLGNEFSVTLLQARQHILRRFGTLAAGLQPIGDVG